MERIALAREYRVVEWLREAYLELIQKSTLNFEELVRPAAEPSYSNPQDRDWEADAKKWEARSRDWETLARISQLQIKANMSIVAPGQYYDCYECQENSSTTEMLCKCGILDMVDKAFRGELESLKENPEHVEPPLPSKIPISCLCPLKLILYWQRQQRRNSS